MMSNKSTPKIVATVASKRGGHARLGFEEYPKIQVAQVFENSKRSYASTPKNKTALSSYFRRKNTKLDFDNYVEIKIQYCPEHTSGSAICYDLAEIQDAYDSLMSDPACHCKKWQRVTTKDKADKPLKSDPNCLLACTGPLENYEVNELKALAREYGLKVPRWLTANPKLTRARRLWLQNLCFEPGMGSEYCWRAQQGGWWESLHRAWHKLEV